MQRISKLPVELRLDPVAHGRVKMTPDKIREYAKLLLEEVSLPPLVAFFDETDYWLADGFHRLCASILAFGHNKPVIVDVRQGTKKDAIAHAAKASDGFPLTEKDKKQRKLMIQHGEKWQNHQERPKAIPARLLRNSRPGEKVGSVYRDTARWWFHNGRLVIITAEDSLSLSAEKAIQLQRFLGRELENAAKI